MKKTFQGIAKQNLSAVVDAISILIKPGVILFFDGDPGAGKTYLISEILKKYNISEVSSPTFALHHQYQSGLQKLIFQHFDLYRIESIDELETIGLWELFSQDQHGITSCYLIEWGSKFPEGIWPLNSQKIWIGITQGYQLDTRHYTINQSPVC